MLTRWYSYVWMSWYLFTSHPFIPLHFKPSKLAKMLIFICLKILILVHPLPPYLAPEPQWPIWDADQIIFMCLNVLILFTPPPPSPCTWSSVIWWTKSVKIKFRSDNKVHFYQFVFHGKWLSLAGPHASFYWSPRGSLRWLFSVKQCTNFQNIELFLNDN